MGSPFPHRNAYPPSKPGITRQQATPRAHFVPDACLGHPEDATKTTVKSYYLVPPANSRITSRALKSDNQFKSSHLSTRNPNLSRNHAYESATPSRTSREIIQLAIFLQNVANQSMSTHHERSSGSLSSGSRISPTENELLSSRITRAPYTNHTILVRSQQSPGKYVKTSPGLSQKNSSQQPSKNQYQASLTPREAARGRKNPNTSAHPTVSHYCGTSGTRSYSIARFARRPLHS